MTTTLANLSDLATGCVRMYPPLGSAFNLPATVPWTVLTPDSSPVPNIGSTQTNGFNETEAYCFTKGWSLEVCGFGEQGGGTTTSSMTAALGSGGFIIKPMAQRFILFRGVIMQSFDTNCMTVDSMVEAEILSHAAQFSAQGGTGCNTWNVKPRTALPVEGFVGINASHIQFGSCSMQSSGTGNANIVFDATSGGINASLFEGLELNGAGAGGATGNYGIQVVSGVNAMGGCLFHFPLIHLHKIAGIKTAANTTGVWEIGLLLPASGVGIDNFGSFNEFHVAGMNASNGTYTNGFVSESGALGNDVVIGTMVGATAAAAPNPGIVENNFWSDNSYFVYGVWLATSMCQRQIVGLTPASVTNGTLLTASTLAHGAISTTGTNSNFTINYGITYRSVPNVLAICNQAGVSVSVTALSTTACTLTTSTAVSAGSQIRYAID